VETSKTLKNSKLTAGPLDVRVRVDYWRRLRLDFSFRAGRLLNIFTCGSARKPREKWYMLYGGGAGRKAAPLLIFVWARLDFTDSLKCKSLQMGFAEEEVYWQPAKLAKKCVKCKLDKMSCRRREDLHVAAKADILRPSHGWWAETEAGPRDPRRGNFKVDYISRMSGTSPSTSKCYLLRFGNINPWVFASEIYGARDTRESFGGGGGGIVVFMTATWPAHINGPRVTSPESRILDPEIRTCRTCSETVF